MVSRDTVVHLAVVLVTLIAGWALFSLVPGLSDTVLIFGTLILYGVLFAGSHLVLALRGEDGLVPVSSRWRFVGFVAFSLCLAAVALLTEPIPLGPTTSDGVLSALWFAGILGYWLLEAREGYLDTAGTGDRS